MKRLVLILLAGVLFGAGLAISGMTDPSRVVDFLDVSGNWDPTLLFVMGGALAVFGGGYAFFRKRLSLPCCEQDPVTPRLLVGAALFGIGWGLGGICPGPGIANLGALRGEILVFVPAMAAGMILVQRIFHVDR